MIEVRAASKSILICVCWIANEFACYVMQNNKVVSPNKKELNQFYHAVNLLNQISNRLSWNSLSGYIIIILWNIFNFPTLFTLFPVHFIVRLNCIETWKLLTFKRIRCFINNIHNISEKTVLVCVYFVF